MVTQAHPLAQIYAFEKAKRATTSAEVVSLIQDYSLVREHIPTHWLKSKEVWEALLIHIPYTALIRNLATLSRIELLTPLSATSKTVCETLLNADKIKASRVHPIALLSALRTYSAGGKTMPNSPYIYYGVKVGPKSQGGEFEVIGTVKAALNEAFYTSFGNIEPTGKRLLLAFDISGSMGMGEIAGVPGLTPREASAALGMVTARTEWSKGTIKFPMYHAVAFETQITPFDLDPMDSLESVVKKMEKMRMGSTDCAQPMIYARQKNVPVDTFIVYTDSETYAGAVHPSQALDQYRKAMGINAQLIVVGMTSTGFSIARQDDPGMLDVVGMDAATPGLISEFARGNI